MSDTPQGPGWWQASDGKFYPPQPPTPPPPPPIDGPPTAPPAPPQFAPEYTPPAAPPYGGQQPLGPPTGSPATGNITVRKKSNVPVILLVLGVIVILGVGGCVAMLVVVGDRVEEAATDNDATPILPNIDFDTDEPPATIEGGGPAGTREAPLPMGTEIDLGNGWRVTVVSADIGPDVAAAVESANEFNEPAPEGSRYILVNLKATFAGRPDASTETPFFGFDYSVFGSANVERGAFDTMASAPEPELDNSSELAAGGEAEGNVVLTVGADETNLVMRLEPSMSFDSTEAWVALG